MARRGSTFDSYRLVRAWSPARRRALPCRPARSSFLALKHGLDLFSLLVSVPPVHCTLSHPFLLAGLYALCPLRGRFRKGFADLGQDEGLDTVTPGQAQPERSSLGLEVERKAEEGTTEPFPGDEVRGFHHKG